MKIYSAKLSLSMAGILNAYTENACSFEHILTIISQFKEDGYTSYCCFNLDKSIDILMVNKSIMGGLSILQGKATFLQEFSGHFMGIIVSRSRRVGTAWWMKLTSSSQPTLKNNPYPDFYRDTAQNIIIKNVIKYFKEHGKFHGEFFTSNRLAGTINYSVSLGDKPYIFTIKFNELIGFDKSKLTSTSDSDMMEILSKCREWLLSRSI